MVKTLLGLVAMVLLVGPRARADDTAHGTPRPSVAPVPERPSYPDMKIIGFTDLDFGATDEPEMPANSGFFAGQFVLHFTSVLSPHFSFNSEVSLSARREAATLGGAGYLIEVERSILKYTRSDRFKFSVGRFHTPISYWNVAYHHGSWLQTTVARPELTQFGGTFLPVHFVGALVEGTVPSGPVTLNYNLGLGNGRSSVASRPGDAGDVNNNRALIGTISARPNDPLDLQMGAAVYQDKYTRAGSSTRELIASAHVAWTRETPELIAEYVWVRHRPVGGGALRRSRAYYVQAAYRLSVFAARLKPYVRYEDMHVAADDPVYVDVPSRRTGLGGVRFEASELVAVKAEYRRQRIDGHRSDVNGVHAQLSFSF